ncbi:hypothetical protein A7X67_13230 [Clostridium sp. W14A]|nr:hypothetical protein A7X67_13230 [Clostridium sp. W14A]
MNRKAKFIGVAALVVFFLLFGFLFRVPAGPDGNGSNPQSSSSVSEDESNASSATSDTGSQGSVIISPNSDPASDKPSDATTDPSGEESTSHRPEGTPGNVSFDPGVDSPNGGNGDTPGTSPSNPGNGGGVPPASGEPGPSSSAPASSSPASSSSSPSSTPSNSSSHSSGGSHSKPNAQVSFNLPTTAYTDTSIHIATALKNTSTLRWTLTRANADGAQVTVDPAIILSGALDKSGGTVTFLESGDYVLTATAANSSGKETAASRKITVYPVAGVAFSLPESTHTDQAVPVKVDGDLIGLDLSWSVQKDGSPVNWESVIDGEPTNDGGIFTFKEPGDFSVTAMAKDSAGREFSHTEKIKVYPVVGIDFDLPDTAHTDSEIDLPVTLTDADGLDIEWSLTKNGEPLPVGDAIDGELSDDGGTIRFTDKGVYTLTAQVTDETGRVFTASGTTTVYPIGSVGFYLPEITHTDTEVQVETSFKNLDGDAEWTITKDGEPVAWEDCVEGPLDNDGGTVRFKLKGSYNLTALYTDPAGRSYTYSSRVMVYPVPTLSFTLPETAHTDADVPIETETSDLDGLTVEWLIDNTYGIQDWDTFVDGTLDNDGGTIRFKHAGVYELVARVTDETGRVFLFEPEDTIDVLPSLSISFSLPGSAYTDNMIRLRTLGNIGGLPVEWSLEKGGQPVTLSEILDGTLNDQGGNIQFRQSGTYTLTATMTDALGREFTHSESVLIRPVAQCSFSVPTSARVNAAIPVSMKEVSGLDGKSIVWSLTRDGSAAAYSGSLTDAGGSITVGAPGNYTLTATVTDDAGRVFSSSQTIEVTNAAPTAPTASASVTRTVKDGKFLVNLNVQATDPDGDAITYEYEGKSEDGYYAVGAHTVRVRAMDSCGAYSNWTAINFTVSNSAPATPVISRNPDGNSVAPGTAITITASSSDPDGDAIHYVWEGRPAETSTAYPLGKNTVKVKAVDSTGAESPWAAIVFFVADPTHGGGMMLTGPESTIMEDGVDGATITSWTFNVPAVSGHNANYDYGEVSGYNIQTGQWERLTNVSFNASIGSSFAATDGNTGRVYSHNGVYMSGTLSPGVYTKLQFRYYTPHDCMYNKSNITYSVNFYWNTN